MFVLLKSDADLMKRHFSAYEEYFRLVSNPQAKGSIAEAIQNASARIDQLAASIQGGPFWCHVGSQFKKCCGQGQTCEYNYFQQAVGSIDIPFQLSGAPITLKTGGPGPSEACVSHERPDHPRGSLQTSASFRLASFRVPVYVAADVYGQPGSQACPDQLKGMKSDRADTISKLAGLNQANGVAKTFADIAHKLAS